MAIKNEPSNMMKHYLSMKEKYKDCILFYRLGDFYEMFFEDAIKVSKLLDLTLTGKNCGLEERAPMCGIPFHSADGYVAKLVSMGEKVAICEQVSDPKLTTGRELVKRDVIRIVSAGTVIEEEYLDQGKNNYIACAYKQGDNVALAWTDITTGEFSAEEFFSKTSLEECISRLINLSVAEIICNEEMLLASKTQKEVIHGALPAFSCYMPWVFNKKHAEKNLLEQFNTQTLAPFGIAAKENVIISAGALIEYLRETQKHALVNVNSITVINRNKYMELDSIAVRNLELLKNNAEGKKYGSLLWVMDKTKTGMGARLLNRLLLSPLKDKGEIEYRQDGVEELLKATLARVAILETLEGISDVERLAGKISNGNFHPRNCLELCASLNALPTIQFQLSGFSSKILRDISNDIPDMQELADLLSAMISPDASSIMKDGGYIREGFNAELDRLRAMKENAQQIIKDIEVRERDKTGIRTLKTGFNRVFGYYIEVSNSFKDQVPADYIRKQTLTTGERYITEELKKFEEEVLTAGEKALALEQQLYNK